jgi:hypothetical protein
MIVVWSITTVFTRDNHMIANNMATFFTFSVPYLALTILKFVDVIRKYDFICYEIRGI